MCGMTHNFTIHRVQLRKVYDWKIDLSIVERSRPDRDKAMLLKLWNCQHSFNICPKHHGLEQVGALAERCHLCGWAGWMRCPHRLEWDTLTP